jgi:hypothetical protein
MGWKGVLVGDPSNSCAGESRRAGVLEQEMSNKVNKIVKGILPHSLADKPFFTLPLIVTSLLRHR